MCYILSGYGQGAKPPTTNLTDKFGQGAKSPTTNSKEKGSEKYDLITDMNKISRKYFKLVSTQPMYNKNVNVTEHKETNERIMIFMK
jgi:hypothetical protein